MPRIVQTDDEFSVTAAPLQLLFQWDGRRWRHEILVGGRTIAASLEWEPERDDPARVVSPSYQQFSSRETAEGAQALLVGQWGTSHGSAVFTMTEDATGVVIEADVAVRNRAPAAILAATYVVNLTSSDLSDAGPSALLWTVDDSAPGRLCFEAGAGSLVGLAEAGRRATRVQATAVKIDGQATQRLRYRWRWINATGLDGTSILNHIQAPLDLT